MKKIKFRAWDKENRTMYAWEDIKYIDLETLQKTNILMQFTGLKDKNGKEIFEGDILAYPDRRKKIIVIVKRVNIAYCEEYGTYANGFRVPEDYKNMIVIGNIYENPDIEWKDLTIGIKLGKKIEEKPDMSDWDNPRVGMTKLEVAEKVGQRV